MKFSKGQKVKVINREDSFFDLKGTIDSIHSDGIIVVLFDDYDISVMYDPSENALKKC